jgi:uncharacterized protein (DUF934 family)
MRIISGFVDTYLQLNATEEQAFRAELDRIGLTEQEQVMEIVTSWMEQEAEKLVLRQLNHRVGMLSLNMEQRVQRLSLDKLEELGIALLDFTKLEDLEDWLKESE